MRSHWIRVGTGPATVVLEEEGNLDTDTQEDVHVTTEAEIGFMLRQVDDRQALPAAARSGRGQE